MLSKEYTTLFNAITDAINILVAAQQNAEEIVISRPEEPSQLEVPCRECSRYSDMSCASHMQSVPMSDSENTAYTEQPLGLDSESSQLSG